MHLLTLVESDPRNFKNFEEWINSREYASRPYCREIRLYDINVKEKDLPYLLGDLKHYVKLPKEEEGKFKTFFKVYNKVLSFISKVFPLYPVDVDNVEKTPKKWFQPIKQKNKKEQSGPMKYVPSYCYLRPLGYIKDRKHKGGNERI